MNEQELVIKNLNKMIDRRIAMLRNCYEVATQRKHLEVIAELREQLAVEMAA